MPANTQKSKKTKTSWKPGQSGNPAGAPKRGESWAERIREIGQMTRKDVIDYFGFMVGQIRKYPEGVELKDLVIIAAYVSLINDPNARLLKEFMDRAEGKVRDEVDLTSGGEKLKGYMVVSPDDWDNGDIQSD